MKITRKQLRRIVEQVIGGKLVKHGNGARWVQDSPKVPRPPRARRVNPETAFRRLQAIARDAGEDWARDNPDGVVADVAFDLARSATWLADEGDVDAAKKYLARNNIGITQAFDEYDLFDMLADSVVDGAHRRRK